MFGCFAAPALAAQPAGCPSSAVAYPFAQFGDEDAYSLVEGGSFVSGSAGWSVNDASVVSNAESYEIGPRSLAIAPSGVAVSPSFCVSTAEPTFRFFVRRTSGSWGVLNVTVHWTEASGASHTTTVASLQPGTAWTPTPVLALSSTLPLWQPGSTLDVRLEFKPEQYGGAFAIDDVYIDPRMS